MAGVSTTHPDIGPELRALAQAILDRLDPAVRAAAVAWGTGQGKCQQVWCPLCALAALVTGEQHPLLSLIAEHSVTLMSMVRAMATDSQNVGDPTPPDGPPEGGGPSDEPNGSASTAPTRSETAYQQIPITIEE
jgi:hypothetical protein